MTYGQNERRLHPSTESLVSGVSFYLIRLVGLRRAGYLPIVYRQTYNCNEICCDCLFTLLSRTLIFIIQLQLNIRIAVLTLENVYNSCLKTVSTEIHTKAYQNTILLRVAGCRQHAFIIFFVKGCAYFTNCYVCHKARKYNIKTKQQ